jgi:hypothetical protein
VSDRTFTHKLARELGITTRFHYHGRGRTARQKAAAVLHYLDVGETDYPH